MGDDATRWLTRSEQDIWRSWLSASGRINSHLEEGLREFGLNLAEYEILVTLSEAPDRRVRMSELAEQVRQSRSRLTHTVSRLEKKALLSRETCTADGRGVWATLMPTGYDLLVEVAPRHVADVRHILVDAVDTDDFAALGRAMASVLAVAD